METSSTPALNIVAILLTGKLGEKQVGPKEARHGWAAFRYDLKPDGLLKKFKLIVADVLGHEETYIYPPGGAIPKEEQDSMWGEVMDVEKNVDISTWEKKTYGKP